jgi:hypothetical protein
MARASPLTTPLESERESSLATQRPGSGTTGRSPAGYGTARPSHIS